MLLFFVITSNAADLVVEAEKAVDGKAEVFRDNRASGSKTAGLTYRWISPFLVTKPSFPLVIIWRLFIWKLCLWIYFIPGSGFKRRRC